MEICQHEAVECELGDKTGEERDTWPDSEEDQLKFSNNLRLISGDHRV